MARMARSTQCDDDKIVQWHREPEANKKKKNLFKFYTLLWEPTMILRNFVVLINHSMLDRITAKNWFLSQTSYNVLESAFQPVFLLSDFREHLNVLRRILRTFRARSASACCTTRQTRMRKHVSLRVTYETRSMTFCGSGFPLLPWFGCFLLAETWHGALWRFVAEKVNSYEHNHRFMHEHWFEINHGVSSTIWGRGWATRVPTFLEISTRFSKHNKLLNDDSLILMCQKI